MRCWTTPIRRTLRTSSLGRRGTNRFVSTMSIDSGRKSCRGTSIRPNSSPFNDSKCLSCCDWKRRLLCTCSSVCVSDAMSVPSRSVDFLLWCRLNIYGFRRIQHGPLKGGYVHKSFIRGRPELSTGVTRRRNNATMAQKVIEMVQNASAVGGTQSEVAANLESMMAEADDEPIRNIAASVDFGSCNLQGVLERIFQAEETDELAGVTSPVKISGGHLRSASGFVFNLNEDPNNEADPDMNALFQILAGNGEDAEEEADPGARVPPMAAAPARGGSDSALSDAEQEEQEEQLSERIFPLKLHKMLEHAERDGIQHIVSWVNNGTGFKVHNSKLFTEQVMPMYFDQTKYESFRRQLNLYCFARISRGPQRGVYSHPSFVSGRRELLSNVTRKISAAESKLPASNSHEDMSPSSNQIRSYTGIHSKHASVTV
mmetsp:Transcript_2352/g.4387  ORF Transcript_2352/g.4387 Transcript_2352/m.4387 type:complete len:429 (-) Transcript_2352:885-2171(-)